MKKLSYSGGRKVFYIALSLSILSVITSVIGVNLVRKKARKLSSEITTYYTHPLSQEETEAAKNQKGIAKDEKQETKETTSIKETQKTVATTAPASVAYGLPLNSTILKDYSNGVPVKNKTMNDYRIHNAVDFSGEIGDEVKAVSDGKVLSVKQDSLWGMVVEIEHRSFVAKYCGLDEIKIGEGDSVKSGQTIGTLGEIPIESADLTHLHLEITVDGKAVDPLKAIGFDESNSPE